MLLIPIFSSGLVNYNNFGHNTILWHRVSITQECNILLIDHDSIRNECEEAFRCQKSACMNVCEWMNDMLYEGL